MGMGSSSGAERTQSAEFKRLKRKLRMAEDSLVRCPTAKEQGEAQNQKPGCTLGLEKKSEWVVGSHGDNPQHPVEGLALHLILTNTVSFIQVSIKSSWGCSQSKSAAQIRMGSAQLVQYRFPSLAPLWVLSAQHLGGQGQALMI